MIPNGFDGVVRLETDRQIRFGMGNSGSPRRANPTELREMMVASDSFAEFLSEQLAPLGQVTTRRMFGKFGVFCDGLMFGVVSDDTLYLRVDDGNRVAFAEAGEFPPLNYEKGGKKIEMSFWRVPERLLDEPDDFVVWAREALAAASRVAAKKPGRGGR